MPFSAPIEPITATDEELRAALEEAELPAMLATLVHVTGDTSLLRDDLRLDAMLIQAPQGGLTPEQQETIRALVLDTLIRFRDGGCVVAPPPDHDLLCRLMEFAVDGADMEPYVPILEEELAITGEDLRAPQWHKDGLAPDVPFSVAIIGAGMSGLLAAHRLQQAGVPFTIIEKNDDVGGTWYENTYPGCRVDNPNHLYSYSFAQQHDWPFHFSTQDVLHQYFARCADALDLRRHIRFGTEVRSATFDERANVWTLELHGGLGTTELEANAVVSAVGQLNRPKLPDIAGRERFAGPAFHSARWDHDVDLRGKRVAVIGTGASAAQFIPEIAADVAELLVFQRTPNWLGPTPEYHDEVPPGQHYLYTHLPFYSQWHRFWIFWKTADGVLPAVRVDPAWEPQDVAVSELNDLARQLLALYLQMEFADRPDLLDKVMPGYPVAAKRIIRDNGVWAATLKRANVRLITEKITEITEGAVVTGDGDEHVVDVLIYGTGFQASKFLTPMTVTGRGSADLHEGWDGEARAYLGVTVPGFPNLFLMYGPNTNIVINGSIVYFSECEARYILGCIELLLAGGHRALDVRREVHDAYNDAVDADNVRMAWGVSDVNAWYKSDSGRVSQNWPFTMLEFWRRTLAHLDEYELLR